MCVIRFDSDSIGKEETYFVDILKSKYIPFLFTIRNGSYYKSKGQHA